MRRRQRLALLAALLAVPGAARAYALSPGDVLVTDVNNARILQVDVATGAVSDFSPRLRSGPNLLVEPAAIASDPGGEVDVVDQATGKLIAIDPATGEQSVVMEGDIISGFSPLDIGTDPRSIAIQRSTPTPGSFRTLWVGSEGALYEVDRELFSVHVSPVVSDPAIQTPYGLAVAESGGVPVDYYFLTGGHIDVYDPVAHTIASLLLPVGGFVTGVDLDGDGVLFSDQITCGVGDGGVFRLSQSSPIASGPLFDCAGAVAIAPGSPFTFYLNDRGVIPEQIVEYREGANPRVIGVMPRDRTLQSIPEGIAVYVPEPDGAALSQVVLAMAALSACARKRARAMARIPSAAAKPA